MIAVVEEPIEERVLWSAALVPAATYNDPLLGSQWHLGSNSGSTKGANVTAVWAEFRGAGVLVGVLDDGVEYTHPDLAANYDATKDFDARDNDSDAFASSTGDRHGTAVAGTIAAALDNATGGSGVAPGATITGYRMGFGASGSVSQVVALFDRIDQLDVANNSWGYDGFLGDNFASSFFQPVAADLENALATGRDGLGTLVVFSAGNSRAEGQNTNYHNFQNDRGIITVAATDSAGNIASFSTPGASILVSAPGVGVVTSDRVGALGYASGDSVSISGTSFSAPIVSGVVALMLEANPLLGWRDVQEILASTAVRTGAAGSWAYNHADNWNGGAMHVSHDFGFGLVDAMAAVRVAESWRVTSVSANELVLQNTAFPALPIPDLGSVQSVLALPSGLRIDRVVVYVQLQHTDIGDLRITLTSPGGTQSVLFNAPPTTQDNISFTFSTTHHLGEDSGGSWTLTVSDLQAGETGALQQWRIQAYGDPADDDTYFFTDEFSVLAAVDPSRLVLSDAFGVDGINTTAIATATTIDLRPGHASGIDGQAVTISAGTVIENADTGDGNDVIIGNDAANSLRGWRGNDTLDGGPGNDILVGGPGNDVLIGGAGNDLYLFGPGFGQDRVIDRDTTAGNVDTIRFEGMYASALVTVSRVGLDLLLAAGVNTVTVESWFGSSADQVERVQFVLDGTLWTVTDLRAFSNLVPVLSTPLPDQPGVVGQAFSFQVPDTTFVDPDWVIGEVLSYSARLLGGGALPGWLAFDAGSRVFSGTPGSLDVGGFEVEVIATDTQGAWVSDAFRITVAAAANRPPVARDDAVGVAENATSGNLAGLVLGNDSDPDLGDVLRVVGVGTAGTMGAVFFDALTQTLTYTANAPAQDALPLGAVMADSFSYTVADGAGAQASATVTVTVSGMNDAPVLHVLLADQVATVGTGFGYSVPSGSFVDVDAGDVLSYGASRADGGALPGWLAFDPATRGFSGTPGAADAGVLAVRVTVTDPHGAIAWDEFVLTVSGGLNLITGTAGNDVLTGTAGGDEIRGLAGNDTLYGHDGEDVLIGGAGSDTMYGGEGDDTFVITGIDAASAYDVVSGGGGYDRIVGGAGDDTLRFAFFTGANTVELIDGGGGVNVIAALAGYHATLDFSGTTLLNIARIEGNTGNDTITGSAGDDVIVGGAGSDTLRGGEGDDTFVITGIDAASAYDVVSGGGGYDRIVGGAGDDTLRFAFFTGANTVELIDGGGG